MTAALHTVHLQYYASGEGWREDIAVLWATDEAQATADFLALFGYGGPDSYFGRGVEVSRGIDRKVLGEWLTPAQLRRLERTLPHSGRFSLRYFFTMS